MVERRDVRVRDVVNPGKVRPCGPAGRVTGPPVFGAPEFLATENDETVLVVQLEDPDALANVDEICAVDHIDVVFVAPNDLAQAMGHQGQPEHPDVAAAIDATLRRIAANGKVAGTNCSRDQIDRFVGLGATASCTRAWMRGSWRGAAEYLAVATTAGTR